MLCVLLFFYCCFFFFNDTATTEIYTYGHTLALHDALPISELRAPTRARHLGVGRGPVKRAWSWRSVSPVTGSRHPPAIPTAGSSTKRRSRNRLCGTISPPSCQHPPDQSTISRSSTRSRHLRSEEHKSELKSLMRISYAVFCLKKKQPSTYIR